MAQLDDALTDLKAVVTENTTIKDLVIALINGIPALIDAAVQKALAAGATPEQLQAIKDVATGIRNNDTAIATAVQADTPTTPTT